MRSCHQKRINLHQIRGRTIFAPALTVLTMHTESHYILQGVRAGAKGVVLKTHASEDLVRAIREASRGGTYMSSQVSSALVQAWATTPARWSAGRARRPAINRQIKGW